MIKTGGVGCVGGFASLGLSRVSVCCLGLVLVSLWRLVAVRGLLVPFASVGGSSSLAFSGGGALVSLAVASWLGRRPCASLFRCWFACSALRVALAGVSSCALAGLFVPSVPWSVLCASACFLICPCFRGRPPLLGGGNGHDATRVQPPSFWRAVCSSCFCSCLFGLRYLGASPSRGAPTQSSGTNEGFQRSNSLTSFAA